jgi:T-complex protein 1 subunit beta
MDYYKIKVMCTPVKVYLMEKVSEIEKAEKDRMKEIVEKIMAYKPDVFFNRLLIYNYPF